MQCPVKCVRARCRNAVSIGDDYVRRRDMPPRLRYALRLIRELRGGVDDDGDDDDDQEECAVSARDDQAEAVQPRAAATMKT